MSSSARKVDVCTVETPCIALRILEDVSSENSEDDENDDSNNNLEDAIGRFVWPTAVPFLRHLLLSSSTTSSREDSSSDSDLTVKHNTSSTSILVELGAGCGVLGMGLAVATEGTTTWSPPRHVLLTDHDEDWLLQNVALNQDKLAEATPLSATRLEWGHAHDICTVRTLIQEKMSSSEDDEPQQLVLLGSDILYNHASHRSLASTLHQLSQASQSSVPPRILLAFPDRDQDEESFVPIAREFFGDTLTPSTPLLHQKQNKRGKNMDLRVIDFTVGGGGGGEGQLESTR